MSNGMLSELEFEQMISKMSKEQLLEWIAREVYRNNLSTAQIRKQLEGDGQEDIGIMGRLTETIRKQCDNRKLIMAMWAFNILIFSAVVGMFVQHIGG